MIIVQTFRVVTVQQAINYSYAQVSFFFCFFVLFFLAHLSHRLRVSYCHWPMSVVRHQQFALNNISSETTRPRALIFDMEHCLMDLYQISSNGGPGIRNGPAAGGHGF